MLLIAVAIASQLSAPVPEKMWFSHDDVPIGWLTPETPRIPLIRVSVAPNGKIERCEIERSGSDVRLDVYTCDLTKRRAKFRSAKWIDGSPAWGVYRTSVIWVIEPGPSSIPEFGDLVVNVSRLPSGVSSPKTANVALSVDAKGKIESCQASDAKQNELLATLACDQLIKTMTPIPARDGKGIAVRSVQRASVSFVKN